MRTPKIVALMFVVLAFAAPLWSQTPTATVRGTVTDLQGRVIPRAIVTLTNLGTNAVQRQSTDNGVFTFEFIPPGEYSLEVAAARFTKKTVDNVRAFVGKQTESNVRLEPTANCNNHHGMR